MSGYVVIFVLLAGWNIYQAEYRARNEPGVDQVVYAFRGLAAVSLFMAFALAVGFIRVAA